MKPTVYFAGKISKRDWRYDITGDERVGGLPDNGGDPIEHQFDPDYRVEYDSFFYGGPFFVSCDHGCGHGREHGNGSCGGEGSPPPHWKIFEVNRKRILKADYMFTFINETSCFGTLIELGIASQRPNLRTAVTFGPNVSIAQYKDLWMAEQCGGMHVYFGSAKDAWQEFEENVLSHLRGEAELVRSLMQMKTNSQ